MRKLQADWLFSISSPPIKNGVLVLNNANEVVEVLRNDIPSDTEKYSGILCPGFVNTHCHLELSHLKNVIPQKTGLVEFVKQIGRQRFNFSEDDIQKSAKKADTAMLNSGVIAVGDISNTTHTFIAKEQSDIHYHHFIELFGFNSSDSDEKIKQGKEIFESLNRSVNKNMVPHAPYSTSEALFKQITSFNKNNSSAIQSVHNQETLSEDEMFLLRKGKMLEFLSSFGHNINAWEESKKTSLQTYFSWLDKTKNIILVHNTFTSREDISYVQSISENAYWCLCPKANLYIEGVLPNLNILQENNCNITIGTDSLASNNELSIISELTALQNKYKTTSTHQLLGYATINGAQALNISSWAGSFENKKKPGVVNITNLNYTNKVPMLTEASKSQKII